MTDRATVHDTLAHRAFLHDDPGAYLAGVDDAVAEADERDDDPAEDDAAEAGQVASAALV